MREIKFRAWDKEHKKMFTEDTADIHITLEGIKFKNNRMKQTLILMQYTGLKDKNGKEIYEGDIIKFDGDKIRYVIIYDYNGFECDDAGLILMYGLTPNTLDTREVIGNIYEKGDINGNRH